MSKTLKLQVIEKARDLIEDERRWCRGELARDKNGLSNVQRTAGQKGAAPLVP